MADPLWINASAGAPAYAAAELRRAFAALLSPKGTAGTNRFSAVDGIRPGGGVVTSLSGSTITVKAHAGVISPDLSSVQGAYVYQIDADATHTLTAAHATLVRNDLVYIQVSDHDEDASGARTVLSGYLAGTPGAGVPSLPARSFELARINVPQSGGGSAVLTERGVFTVASGGVLPVRDTTDLPAHYESRVAGQLDTDRLMISDGTAWQRGPHWSVAGRTGCQLYKAVSAIPNATATAVTWGVENQDTDGFIAVPSTTVTIPAGLGGLYDITFRTAGSFATGAGRHFVMIDPTSTTTNMPADFRMPMEASEDAGLISLSSIPLAAGDTFTCQIYHSDGASVNFESWLSCYRRAV